MKNTWGWTDACSVDQKAKSVVDNRKLFSYAASSIYFRKSLPSSVRVDLSRITSLWFSCTDESLCEVQQSSWGRFPSRNSEDVKWLQLETEAASALCLISTLLHYLWIFFFFLSGPSHTTALCQNLTSTSFHTGSCVMIISQQHRLRHSVRELKTHMNLCLLLLKGTPTTYSSSTSLFLFILHQWELLTFLLHSFLNNTRPNPLPSHGTLIRDNSQVNWTLYCLRLCSLRGENLHLMAMFTLEFLWTHCLTN